MNLEKYFFEFRKHIIGNEYTFGTPYGMKKIHYFDWTGSGRLYAPIEKKIANVFGPLVGNTHTESTITGSTMTRAYKHAQSIIKKHVGADKNDVILTQGTGATGVIHKLQRILGLKVPEKFQEFMTVPIEKKPIVFVTHMEHHSNHTSWLEAFCDVEVIEPDENGNVSLVHFQHLLEAYKEREFKIGAFTACSNVTGIQTPYHCLAKMIHEYNGFCMVDFSACAPYVEINMHPADPIQKLDAIVFSPHKFLGGPGTSGVLVFDSRFYQNDIPESPGGGTVKWTNPWGGRRYYDDIEAREDGGTPGFLQTIRTSLSILLKEQMGVKHILQREKELLDLLFQELDNIEHLHILGGHVKERMGIVSFYIEGLHFNLLVKAMNDKYGIQLRGGCSCAGTYGHFLLNINQEDSKRITDEIDSGNYVVKPGWARISLHPTMTNSDILYLTHALKDIATNRTEIEKEYEYSKNTNEFTHTASRSSEIEKLFNLS
ncbi:aminotransferase class V-fold PLP-dependent enzyme [Peribacillus deserti]|uniref:Selenocysteine lyase n=1 Tax=Peribacillus deserti TaxID=673318 RepID=A0A2N5M1I4_9BACI|nr:aminotransferase class V-fold PLP-dependent enzyme [Peribacillus deserti]PLT28165.1 selenocysteine lyase [Peribacillus deserti]